MIAAIHMITLLGILSLTLGGLAGCGEKRVHVATLSGAPGEEMDGETTEVSLESETTGLEDASVNEASLDGQLPVNEDSSLPSLTENTEETSTAPLDFAHEPASSSNQEIQASEGHDPFSTTTSSGLSSDIAAETASSNAESNPSSFSELSQGPADEQQGSDSIPGLGETSEDIPSSFTNMTNDETARTNGEFSSHEEVAGLGSGVAPNALGEGLENIPDSFDVAKVEPNANLEEQLERMKAEELAAARAGLEDIFFPFDSWSLTTEGKQSLERDAKTLSQSKDALLLIEGHTDQRGTQAYNMILGKKRAAAIRDYLSQLGVESSRLAIISYGKDKPFCQEPTEVCHQLNRRGHLLIQNP